MMCSVSTSQKQKPLHLEIKKDGTVNVLAVSPFDGVNRIRFKGSLNIADLRLPIAN